MNVLDMPQFEGVDLPGKKPSAIVVDAIVGDAIANGLRLVSWERSEQNQRDDDQGNAQATMGQHAS